MYYITMLSLIAILLYRQFVLNQAIEEFKDIANVVTFNVIVMLGAVFYFGGISFRKFKMKSIIITYIVFVIIGFLFTCFKYKVLIDPPLSMSEIAGKLYIIMIICGLLTAFWALLAYLGNRKIGKDLR